MQNTYYYKLINDQRRMDVGHLCLKHGGLYVCVHMYIYFSALRVFGSLQETDDTDCFRWVSA